jgi:hypothetical protein
VHANTPPTVITEETNTRALSHGDEQTLLAAGYDPTAPPPPEEIARAIIACVAQNLLREAKELARIGHRQRAGRLERNANGLRAALRGIDARRP